MHALVVGGTGMLREATLHLAERYEHITLIARRPERIGERSQIHGVALDYRETDRLGDALRQAIKAHGPIGLALCWIHSTAPEALPTVVWELGAQGLPFRLVHVRGSAVADPTRLPIAPDVPAQCRYHQVILGFKVEGRRSRWLTNREISEGVIRAIETDTDRAIVGMVRPWELRPGW